MIDTIIVAFRVAPKIGQLYSWVNNPLITPDKKVFGKYFVKAAISNGAPVDFVYYPPNHKYPAPMLRVQVSLPNVIYGNNVEMILTEAEIDQAITKVNEYMAEKKWLPSLDLGEGTLYRIDACYNHPVEERVQDYIRALSRLTYPGRKTGPYQYEGVQFRSSSRRASVCLSFYDKFRESHNPLAHGFLRQETSIRRTYFIGKRMGLDKPTLRDVKITWLQDTLQLDLDRLGISSSVICDRGEALEMLLNKHGPNTGLKLFGYLSMMQSMDKEQFAATYDAKERTMQRWDSQIAEAGVASAMTESQVQLAPLSVDVWTAKNGVDL